MEHFIFPQSSQDNLTFKNVFYPLWKQYSYNKNTYKIIKNKNSQYERLTNSIKRGKPASMELINALIKECDLNINGDLKLLFDIQNIKKIDSKDDIFYLIAREDLFKEHIHSQQLEEGYKCHLNIIKKEMTDNSLEKKERLESVLTLLSAMELNREEVIKIIHHLARV